MVMHPLVRAFLFGFVAVLLVYGVLFIVALLGYGGLLLFGLTN